MALKGTLQDFSLADIFQLIGIQQKTGILTLKRDQEVYSVLFEDGHVVGAESGRRRLEDRLGKVLVKTGRITEAQLQGALRAQQQTLKLLGHVLIDNKVIDSEVLRDALQVQISQLIYRLFRWTSGVYDFNQEARVEYDKALVTPMSAESILMEGARIIDEWPMIQKRLHSFSAVFRKADVEIAEASLGTTESPSQDNAAGNVTLNDPERQVYQLVDGRRNVQEIIERSRLSEFETCRLLYELISRQLVEEVDAPSEKGAVVAPKVVRPASSLVLGLAYLALVLVAGIAVLYRSQPWVGLVLAGERLQPALAHLVADEELATIRKAVSDSRIERIDLAIQVYYLLHRGYPTDLMNLVASDLLQPQEILDGRGRVYPYEVHPGGYRLADGNRS